MPGEVEGVPSFRGIVGAEGGRPRPTTAVGLPSPAPWKTGRWGHGRGQ
ncbi:hypothetical protein NXF25_019130 [Crotalus adamanteus]|uniref:Uncharacterized protein n=1 Tax=Crotalus adamanteus TaxID=8729 RepID=A0AAW1B1L2_CROAD